MSSYRKKAYKKVPFDPLHEKGIEERVKEEVNLFKMEENLVRGESERPPTESSEKDLD